MGGKVAPFVSLEKAWKSLWMKEIAASAGLWVRAPSRIFGPGTLTRVSTLVPAPAADKATTSGRRPETVTGYHGLWQRLRLSFSVRARRGYSRPQLTLACGYLSRVGAMT